MRIKANNLAIASLLSLTVLLGACSEKPFFDKTYAFDGKVWEQRVRPTFEVNIQDTAKYYDFVLTLRTTADYSYSNLWVFLNSETPNGITAREPFQFHIANPDGSWIGQKSGTMVDNQMIFKKRKFPIKGKYKFSIEQGITEKVVDQVMDINLWLQEAK
jgi:gliding motility-associated lipoprotein GldH